MLADLSKTKLLYVWLSRDTRYQINLKNCHAFTMEYFKKTSHEKFRFLDFYRYRQKQDDFTRSFREESGNLWRCLKSLVKDETPQVKENAVRLQKSFEASVYFLYLWYTSCRQVWGLLLKSREGVTYFHDYGRTGSLTLWWSCCVIRLPSLLVSSRLFINK